MHEHTTKYINAKLKNSTYKEKILLVLLALIGKFCLSKFSKYYC